MTHDFFSVAQMFGYATFILSMITFSRKQDGHFRIWLTGQNLLYATHLYLMGNPAGTAGSLLSALRNVVSMRTRSVWAIASLLSINFLIGFYVVKSAWNILPLVATAIATVSMFRLQGLQLRLGMFCATLLWLMNNILTGSIGATIMEAMTAVISSITIFRLYMEHKNAATLHTPAAPD